MRKVHEVTADIKSPPTNYGGCQIRAGTTLPENLEPDRELLPTLPNFEKNITIALLKTVWQQILYWVHFTFKV